jgi:hypothetical protein
MSHARPTSKEYDFHRSQDDCFRLDLYDSIVQSVRIEEQEPWTWTVLEDSGEWIDVLLAASICIIRVILDVIMSGCSCMIDLSAKISWNEIEIVI